MATLDGRLVRIMGRYTPQREEVPEVVQMEYEEYLQERVACGMEDTLGYLKNIPWVVYRTAGHLHTLPEEEYFDLLD